jgi:hypothetical protein
MIAAEAQSPAVPDDHNFTAPSAAINKAIPAANLTTKRAPLFLTDDHDSSTVSPHASATTRASDLTYPHQLTLLQRI